MNKYQYQHNFSNLHPELYNISERKQKAKKIISVLEEFCSDSLGNMSLLDIGSSTGIITHYLSKEFKKTTGIDIDVSAVQYANKEFKNESLNFSVGDAMSLSFPDSIFDVVICAHVHEHVPDSKRLMDEVYRVLKPGGVCFFSAGNRLVVVEAHHHLPLLSVFPKFVAHYYVRLFNKAEFYYENHLAYFGLQKLVSKFTVYDYTLAIVKDPVKYSATEMIDEGSLTQQVYLFLLKAAYWLCPTYIWVLKKDILKDY
nr:class I SAM-dependent methyltransferase [Bacteroidota bacterium]